MSKWQVSLYDDCNPMTLVEYYVYETWEEMNKAVSRDHCHSILPGSTLVIYHKKEE